MNPRNAIKKNDGFWAYYFAGQIANIFARIGAKTKWATPNLYTTISTIFDLIACVFFILQYKSYYYLLLGIIFLNLSFIFDCADGQLSRLKNCPSQFGHWYDYHSDKVKDGLVLLSLALGAYLTTGKIIIFIFAFLGIFFQFLRNISRLNRQVFELENNLPKTEEAIIKNPKSQFLITLKNSTLFKEADRVLLFTIFGLINQAFWIFPIYFALELFYAALSSYLTYKRIYKFEDNAEKR